MTLADREAEARRDSECVEWRGSVSPNGYGRLTVDGRTVYAHRFAYQQQHGEIPAGYQVHHRCGNRLCVRVSHLEALTQKENIQRSSAPQAVNALKTHCVAGHALSGDNLYITPDGRRQCRACDRVRLRRRHRDPAKTRAKWAVNNAIRDGRLVKPSACGHCGRECRPEGHHPDYSKPLEVVWLCRPCHQDVHNGSVPCPECGGEGQQFFPVLRGGRVVNVRPCPTCHGTGSIPTDSILLRVREGRWPEDAA